jgi:hypothetical protein
VEARERDRERDGGRGGSGEGGESCGVVMHGAGQNGTSAAAGSLVAVNMLLLCYVYKIALHHRQSVLASYRDGPLPRHLRRRTSHIALCTACGHAPPASLRCELWSAALLVDV